MSTNALARPASGRTRRAPLPPPSPQPRLGVPFTTVADIPDRFAMRISGDCLAPDLMDGDEVVFTKDARPKAGDLAILILRPELVAEGDLQCAIKRLALDLPPYVTLPWTEHPESTVHAMVIAEQANPPRHYGIKCERLLAVLRFSHIQRRAAS